MKCKKIITTGIGLLTALYLGLAKPNKALAQEKQEQKINFSANLAVSDKDFMRGINFSNKMQFNANVNVNHKNLTAMAYENFDTASKTFSWGGLMLDYSNAINDKLFYSVGMGGYHFGKELMGEVYAGIISASKLNPNLFLFGDFGDYGGIYAIGFISQDFDYKKQKININFALAYNHNNFRQGSGFSNLEASVAVPIKIKDKISVCPKVLFSKALSSDFKDELLFTVNVSKNP